MSTIKGLRYMIKRQGENGKIGPYYDATCILYHSPLFEDLREKDYYEGSAEEWVAFYKEHGITVVPGDMDGDGDYDSDDAEKIEEMNKEVSEQKKDVEEAREAGEMK